MTIAAEQARIAELKREFAPVINPDWKQRIAPLSFLAAGLGYFIYLCFYFDLGNIADRWNSERAALFAVDTYAHKIHVDTRWQDTNEYVVTLEGSRFEKYDENPNWVERQADSSHLIDMGNDGKVQIFENHVIMTFLDTAPVRVDRPLDGTISATSEAPLPEWIRVTRNKVEVRPTNFSRVQISKTKIRIFRYFAGWEHFWFDFNSPLANYSLVAAIGASFEGPRLSKDMSNFSLIFHEWWNNTMWLHRDVWWALVDTLFMAVMGTFLAAFIGLPLAFLAASNLNPIAPMRFVLRRLFDALRGIDMLIWSLIFIRAFGMGPFSGLLAIAITDIGTLGKLMSEAIENIDKKQVEGVKSTGSGPILQYRFGILPQILPLFISQTLYYLESNTRGAVIIGAMGAGGIGLQFLGAMRTGNSWENVAYIAFIVLVTVMLMDIFSAKLRRRLIN